MTFYNYKLGKKTISIQTLHKLLLIWQQMCQKTDIEALKIWEQIYMSCNLFRGNRGSLINLPKSIDPRLSYLLGWICGDGNIVSYNNHYLLKISEKSTNQLNYVLKPLLKDVFNIHAPIYHIYQGGFAIQINSKPLFRFLKHVLELNVDQIPRLAYKLDNINLAYFLAGIFDSEGYVCRNRYRLIIAQAKKEFLLEIFVLFNRLGIKFNGPTQHTTSLGRWYTIRLEKKSEIKKFYSLIGSYHIDKSLRLKYLITKMRKRE